jgi:hypothetical protein
VFIALATCELLQEHTEFVEKQQDPGSFKHLQEIFEARSAGNAFRNADFFCDCLDNVFDSPAW